VSRDDRDASSSIAERALLRRDPGERQHVIEDSKRQMAGVDGKTCVVLPRSLRYGALDMRPA
jgi:hypothetical protein